MVIHAETKSAKSEHRKWCDFEKQKKKKKKNHQIVVFEMKNHRIKFLLSRTKDYARLYILNQTYVLNKLKAEITVFPHQLNAKLRVVDTDMYASALCSHFIVVASLVAKRPKFLFSLSISFTFC